MHKFHFILLRWLSTNFKLKWWAMLLPHVRQPLWPLTLSTYPITISCKRRKKQHSIRLKWIRNAGRCGLYWERQLIALVPLYSMFENSKCFLKYTREPISFWIVHFSRATFDISFKFCKNYLLTAIDNREQKHWIHTLAHTHTLQAPNDRTECKMTNRHNFSNFVSFYFRRFIAEPRMRT